MENFLQEEVGYLDEPQRIQGKVKIEEHSTRYYTSLWKKVNLFYLPKCLACGRS